MKSFKHIREGFEICKTCGQDPCVCDDSFGFIDESKRMSAAVKLQRAFQREQEKSEASRKRGEELLKSKETPMKKEDVDTSEKHEMAQTQLHFIKYAAEEILEYIEMGGEIEEWYQNKLSKVQSEVESLHSYVEGESRRTGMKEETEQLEEGRPSQRHPLEGHEYHRKTDAELVYIAKDAHKAAEAMKSHNTTAENKYRDQANDSATVRYYRKQNGMQDWYKKKYGHMKEEQQVDEIVKPDVKNDIKTLDPVSFVKKHGVRKGQAKAMAEESSMAEKQAQKQYRDARKNDVPFDPPYTTGKKPSAVAGKFGSGYSTARHLARQAMNKVANKYKSPIKEEGEMSKKAQIVKSVAKKGKKADSFCAEPVISKTEVKM